MTTPTDDPFRPLGVGIIGLGSIGRTHAGAIDAVDGLEVRASVGGEGWEGATSYGSASDPDAVAHLLADPQVDAVAICSPSGLHAEHTVAALEAGKHVLVEKPVATTVADARRVVRAAEQAHAEHGAVAGVVSQRRLEPQHVHLKKLVESGELGRPLLGEALVRWFRDKDYYDFAEWRRQAPGGGSLMNQGLHSVDLLRWLFGEVTEVAAVSDTLVADMEAEDTSVAALRFASGALGSIVTSTATRPGLPAELNLYFGTGTVAIHHTDVARWDVDAPAPPQAATVDSGASSPMIGTEGHQTQWSDLLLAIRTGSEPMVTVADGAATVALIEAVYESARTGQRVTPERI
ncbi:MAG TPA: Gfo/Idh/MocA family oxidoreductase [Candidatus Avipropionibacterium avicola]|uniref:Gfo/Idh/MocA family oxidoreductase n=1 Tax=Candidatus Avipropionibacterium avicola TaxID=2840701 RepID=A0A9D1KLH7_9ACTN|nr:Gfo/Idh/MocA family oxidoreductase [Candidatus Avipropionibacterium avicola]